MKWKEFFNDIQLLLLAMILINATRAFEPYKGILSWCVFLSGTAFVFLMLWVKHTDYLNKKRRTTK